VVNVTKIASMLERATDTAPTPALRPVAAGGRFARDPGEYATRRLQLVRNNAAQPVLTGIDSEEVR
jgi:hypothetical protein